MKKQQYITILRALAILAVIAVHSNQYRVATDKMRPFLLTVINNGNHGVQLFYMLSAFTLFMSCKYHSKKSYSDASFFIRRFFRIAPLYYLAIAYYLWQNGMGPSYWLGDAKGISGLNIASNFVFAHGLSPYWINSVVPGGWSVGIEFMFYFSIPFLFKRIKNIGHAANFLMITFGIRLVFNFILTAHPLITDELLWDGYMYLYFPNQLPLFGMGILLYFIIYDDTGYIVSPKTIFILALALLAELATGVGTIVSPLIWFGIAFIFLVLALKKYHPKILFNPFFDYIGTISYTLYLTHFASLFLLRKFNLFNLINPGTPYLAAVNFMANYVLVIGASVLISTWLYYAIELPMQKFGKKLIDKMNAVKPAVAGN